MKLEKTIALLHDTKDINKIGAWLEHKGHFEKCSFVKVIWWYFAILSISIQTFLFWDIGLPAWANM